MKLRGAQWNIQAARVLIEGREAGKSSSYEGDNPEYFAESLGSLGVDFVTLQEVHANDKRDQAREIAKLLNLKHTITHSYGESFMDSEYDLSQSIISRYPIVDCEYLPIDYKSYEIKNPENMTGENYVSRENGLSVATIQPNGRAVQLATTHLLPFSLFGVDPFGEKASEVRSSLAKQLSSLGDRWILQADLNVVMEVNGRQAREKSLGAFLGTAALSPGFRQVVPRYPTVPGGVAVDHIATQNIDINNMAVDQQVKTDHYLMITDYEV